MEKLIITAVADCFFARDPRGHKIEMQQRKYACFIVTVKGKIRFTFRDRALICDRAHPVFLPQGACYLNECLDTAESYVFNFLTKDEHQPMSLSPPCEAQVRKAFDCISKGHFMSFSDEAESIGELYFLLSALFATPPVTLSEKVLHTAREYIYHHYASPSLSVKLTSQYCFVSESYLRKLFLEKLGRSPFQYITDVRMQKAQTLLYEKRPVGEIACLVGYSDVYQFSRAYKRYYGYAPSMHSPK
ncbi:MAG: helix-turn-helix transcriptional regulator [Ruminococcaceae bacterium]|nr:helix-turn-helix transcriptional regulator [Oscillospiraceae bacterium]